MSVCCWRLGEKRIWLDVLLIRTGNHQCWSLITHIDYLQTHEQLCLYTLPSELTRTLQRHYATCSCLTHVAWLVSNNVKRRTPNSISAAAVSKEKALKLVTGKNKMYNALDWVAFSWGIPFPTSWYYRLLQYFDQFITRTYVLHHILVLKCQGSLVTVHVSVRAWDAAIMHVWCGS